MARMLKSVVFYKGTMYRPGDTVPEETAAKFGDHLWTDNPAEVDDRIGPRGLTDTTLVPRESGTGFNRPWPSQDDAAEQEPGNDDGAGGLDADDTSAPGENPGAGDSDAAADGAAGKADDADTASPQQDAAELKAPPRSGKGSGLDAWRAYARDLGIEVTDDADRDDVMAAVDAHRLSARAEQK